jgi:hypothetical protein
MARRVVMTALLALAVGLAVFGFQQTKETNPEVKITDVAVKAVYPASGDLDLRQSAIGFQLDPAYTGRLVVDGIPIPDDQVHFAIGLNKFTYEPGPGTETGALRPGRHTAEAIFWRIGQTERQGRSYRWSFNVH